MPVSGRGLTLRSAAEAVNPVAMLLNARGDYLLNLPALRGLAHIFDGRLTVVCRPGARRTFFPKLALRKVYEPRIEFDGSRPRFDPTAVMDEVGPTDLFLSLNPWHSRDMDRLLELLAPGASVGFDEAFSVTLGLDFDKHSADLAFDVPRCVDPSLVIERFAGPPRLEDESVRLAAELRSLVTEGYRVLIVHAETKPAKMWPIDRWGVVLEWFLARHPDTVVLDVGLGDVGLDRMSCGDRVIPCAGLPLSVAVALLEWGDFFIGVDSCFLHAADLFRVPGVGLFGPTSSREFGFRFGAHRHVNGRPSMHSITVDDVIEAVRSLEDELGVDGEAAESDDGRPRHT